VKLTLRREPSHPDCTLGMLECEEVGLSLVTIERPWIPSPTTKGGLKGKSCVPAGTYHLVKHNSPKHPYTWALVNHDLDVVHFEGDDIDPDEDRATCLIHAANYADELLGCIAPGTHMAKNGDRFMAASSRRAMDIIKDKLPWDNSHTLEII
jgi:hypothetical protein